MTTLTSDQFEEKNTNDIQAATSHSLKRRGPDDEDEDRRGETGLRKPNANAPGPGLALGSMGYMTEQLTPTTK